MTTWTKTSKATGTSWSKTAKATSTSWSKTSKASGTSWAKTPKAVLAGGSSTISPGTPIGLLLALTYASSSGGGVTPGTSWSKLSKSSGTSWTKTPKAT